MPEERKIVRTVNPEDIPKGQDFTTPNVMSTAQEGVAAVMRSVGNGEIKRHEWAEDSKVIETPKGHQVELGPPPVATAFLISRILSEQSQAPGSNMGPMLVIDQPVLRAMMYVRAINGTVLQRVLSHADALALGNLLGDEGLEHVVTAVQHFWPMPTPATLNIIKK